MRLDELDICCARPMLAVEERRIPSASPYIIAPLWQMRIVCKNCGKNTYWVDDYNKATRLWQGDAINIEKGRKENMKVNGIGADSPSTASKTKKGDN